MNTLQTTMLCFFYALLNSSGAALIKWNLTGKNLVSYKDYLEIFFKPVVLMGFLLIFFSVLIMFKVLSVGKFTYVIPVATGINFLLTVIIGIFLFSDKLNYWNFAGVVFIIGGIILLSIKTVNQL